MAMSREDMLKMLDLGAKAPGSGGKRVEKPKDFIARREKTHVDPSRPTTPDALVTDEWDRRRGSEIADKIMSDRKYRSLISDVSAESVRSDMSDMFAACYLCDPKPTDNCVDSYKSDFIKELIDSTTHKSLRISTQLNDAASEIAAIKLYEAYEGGKRKGRSAGTAAEDGAEDAEEELDKLDGACIAMGLGHAGRSKDKTVKTENVIALYDRIRRNPKLQRIVDLAGRMRLFGQSQQKRKRVHGSEDLIGITTGDDISRLVSSEQAALCIEATKLEALRRIVEKQAMIKHMVNHEPVAKGPFIGVVDESGSMDNKKIEEAKALVLSMAWIARSQGRWCGLIAYSGDTGHRLLALPPGKWDEMLLCDWLEQFISGGSWLDLPIREMPDFYNRIGAPKGKTDVIFITDAECHIPDADRDRFLAWKKEAKVRLTSLIIRNEAGNLDAISDDCYNVPKIDVSEEGVAAALSF